MQPMLSFAVVDAGKCKIKASLDDGEDGEELNSGRYIDLHQWVPSHATYAQFCGSGCGEV